VIDELRDAVVDPEIVDAIDALPNHVSDLGFDAWGFSPRDAKLLYSLGKRVYEYFRPIVTGAENVPAGRVLVVANHGGQLPYDGVVVAVSCLLHCTPPRLVRPMVERYFPRIPWINVLFSRGGAVLGAPINCKNLLEDEQAILVFPEGARGSGKLWKDRYKLVDFGRGFMRLALQTHTPIVPCAVVGSEESIVSVANAKPLAKMLGAPYFPVPPLLPLLGPFAYVPLPTRFHVTFGPPMTFEGAFDDEDAAVQEKVDRVRATVQSMVDEGLARRGEQIF
jgi:1-acyl-sn-glycerol-3-phosphate acyltransferase